MGHRIVMAGHSAGGHLCAMALATDWTAFDLPRGVISAALLVSGVFDLEPIRVSENNEHLGLTEETARISSPLTAELVQRVAQAGAHTVSS